MKLNVHISGPLQANNYLLTDDGDAVMIDCSEVKPEMLKQLEGKNLKYILLTHGHFDHVLGVNTMHGKTGAKVLVNRNDVERMDESADIMRTFGVNVVETPAAEGFVSDGDVLRFGNTEIKVIATPGHTEGSVCYLIDGKLFSGDTLFKDSVGRCDLAGGNFQKLEQSIHDKIFKLNDDMIVYPGHGPQTTIGYEKQYNEIV